MTVADEIGYIRAYLDIYRRRFLGKFDFEIALPDAMLGCTMQKMLLQPLVENCIKHGLAQTKSGGCIRIEGSRQDGACVFAVQDNGRGICPEDLHRLVQELSAVDAAARDGIGLFNVHQRVVLERGPGYGIIDLQSVEGEYTRCSPRVRLPMYKIIFLDDEMMTLKLLEHAVDWQKYKIDLCGSASDGEEGISLFQQVQPDIVITDIRMPRMNGIELAAALRQTTKKAKILLFSAYAEFEYAQSAITYEISEYLLKPLDEDKLEAAIARIVQELDREQALSSTIESYRLEQAERQLQQLFAGGRSGARRDLPVPLPDQIAAACGPVDTLLACVCTAEPHEPELRSDVEVVRLRLKEQLGPMTPIVAISPVELIALAAASRLGPQFATLADTLHSLRSRGCPLVVGVGPLADPPTWPQRMTALRRRWTCFYSGQALCTTLPSGPALAGDRAGAAPLGLVEFEQPIAALVEQGKDRDLNACLQSRLATLLQLHAEPELICSFVFAILNWVKIELTKQHRTGVPGASNPSPRPACGRAATRPRWQPTWTTGWPRSAPGSPACWPPTPATTSCARPRSTRAAITPRWNSPSRT